MFLFAIMALARRCVGASAPTWGWLGPFGLALLGTFIGAAVAFHLERRDRARRELRGQVVSGRRAQLALVSQLDVLVNLDEKLVKKYRNDEKAWWKMPPVPFFPEHIPVDFASLDFLLGAASTQLLHDLVVAQFSLSQAISALKYRSTLLDEARSRAAAVGKYEVLDAHTERMLQDATTAVFKHVPEAIEHLHKEFGELWEALRVLHPQEDFMPLPPLSVIRAFIADTE